MLSSNVNIIAVLCFLSASMYGQTTFTAEVSNIWENPANWSNGIPAVGNDATIPSGLQVVIEQSYTASNAIEFNIYNFGSISNFGTFHNQGTIFNVGSFSNYWNMLNVENEGVIINYGTFGSYADSSSQSSGTFINYGTIENYTEFGNGGILYNSESGLIRNVWGQLTNFIWSDIFNEGSIVLQGNGAYNYGDVFSCSGEIQGTFQNNSPITQNCPSFSFGSSEVYVVNDLTWPCEGGQTITAYGIGLSDVQVLINQEPVPINSQDFGHISFSSLPLSLNLTGVVTLSFISSGEVLLTQNVSYDEFIISSENPSGLSCSGGEAITLLGSGLCEAEIFIDGQPIPIDPISSSTLIRFNSPPGVGVKQLTVTSPFGGCYQSLLSYTELTVSSENPSGLSCSGGEAITLLGSGLCEAEIFIDGQPIPVDPISSSTLIRFISPPGVGVKQLTVTSPSGSYQSLLSYTKPSVNNIFPSFVSCQGGETITLLGNNLCEVQLYVGGQQIPIIASNASSVTFSSPIGYGEQDVIVTNPSGYARTQLIYGKPEVYSSSPLLTGLSCQGGEVIELMGVNFCEAEVIVDGQSVNILASSPNSITFITPSGSGVNDVLVSSPSGTDRISLSYGGPSVTGLMPEDANLLCAGFQEITFMGTNLCDAEVFVAGQLLPVVSSGPNYITCTTLPGMGEMSVLIVSPSGSGYSTLNYGGISVDSIFPVSEGSICEEGVDFIITGMNLCEAQVYIGDQELPVLYSSMEEMRICVPSGICDANILIQSQSGSVWSVLSNDLSAVTSISQSNALPCVGGSILSLFGVGLCNANVFVAGNEASLTNNSNSSLIEVVMPQGVGQSELVVYKGGDEIFSTWLEYEMTGCTDSFACNYNPAVACDDGSCEYTSCAGCTYLAAPEYNPDSTIDDGSCSLSVISTCPADLNNDLIINTADLLFLLDGFGTSCN